MIDRRSAILFGAGAALGFAAPPALRTAHADTVKLTDDGLHYQPWFEQTFLDLKPAILAIESVLAVFIARVENDCKYAIDNPDVIQSLGTPDLVSVLLRVPEAKLQADSPIEWSVALLIKTLEGEARIDRFSRERPMEAE